MPHTRLAPSSAGHDLDVHDLVVLAARAAGVGAAHLYWRHPERDRLEPAGGSDVGAAELTRLVRGRDPLVSQALERRHPVLLRYGEAGATAVLVRVAGADGVANGLLAFDPGSVPVDQAFLERARALADVVGRAVRAGHELRATQRANRELRSRAYAERRLTAAVRDGAGLAALVRECSTLTGKPVTLFAADERQLTRATPGGLEGAAPRSHGIREFLTAAGPLADDAGAVLIAATPANRLRRRAILARVAGRGEHFGWLLVDEHPSRFGSADPYAAELAAAHLAAEFVVQRRVTRAAWNARSSLARQMVRGSSDPEDLVASAEYLGVDPRARRVLAHVFEPYPHPSPDAHDERLAAAVEQQLGSEVLATRGSEGVLLLIEALPQLSSAAMVGRVKGALERATARLHLPDEVIVGISSVCDPAALSRGYREAREVVRCIDRFAQPGGRRVLSSLDLGPARLFLANTESSAIHGYVVDVLGALLTGEPGTADLLLTLQCYFDHGRSVRTSAAELGVHENTVRLRLARVTTATGLDVASDANDQLSVQTALLVLRLQGHPVLPSLDHWVSPGSSTGASNRTGTDEGTGSAGEAGTDERKSA